MNPLINEKIEIDAHKCNNADDFINQIKLKFNQYNFKIEIENPPELPLIYIKDEEEFKMTITTFDSTTKPEKTILYTIKDFGFSSSFVINTIMCRNIYDFERQFESELSQYDFKIQIENPPKLPLKYLKDRQEFQVIIRNHYYYNKIEKNCQYSIKKCDISSYFKLDTYKCQNEHDIIKLIASDLHLDPNEYSIKVENMPKLPLKYIKNYYKFSISISTFESTCKPTKTLFYELSHPYINGKIEIDTRNCTNKYELERQIENDLQVDSFCICIENTPKLPFKYLKDNHKFLIKLKNDHFFGYKCFKFILKHKNSSYQIELDTKNCDTVDDYMNKITNALKINSSQINIENPPKLPLNYIKYNNIFYIRILNAKDTIWFYFLQNGFFQVQKYRNMQYDKIINFLNDELAKKSIYCLNVDFYLKMENDLLPRQEFPLIKVEDGTIITVETNDSIKINYKGMQFNFKENEEVFKACEYIKKYFLRCLCVNILDEENNNLLISDKIHRSKKYNLKIDILVNFLPFSPYNGTTQKLKLDYHANVLNAKSILSTNFCKDEFIITADDITIYDKNKQEIKDSNLELINIQNINCDYFYFDLKMSKNSNSTKQKSPNKTEKSINNSEKEISKPDKLKSKPNPGQNRKEIKPPSTTNVESKQSKKSPKPNKSIPILFKFEEDCGEISSFTRVVPISSTINELSENIQKEYLKDKEIDIKYENSTIKFAIDPEMTIEDVLEEISEGGNVLFIGIKSQKMSSKNISKPKVSKFKPSIKPA